MYDYGYSGLGSTSGLSGFGLASVIWLVIALIASIAGCFIIYFLFVKKDGKETNKTLAWLKSFLRFDKMLIEPILKISYIFTALLITLGSFALIGTNFLGFLGTLVFGNLIARVSYEACLMAVMIWKNTTEINQKMK